MPEEDIFIQRYLEGSLDEAGAERLQQMLLRDPDLGERLLSQLETDAMIRSTRPVTVSPSRSAVGTPIRRFGWSTVSAAAAMAACVAVLGSVVVTQFLEGDAPAESTTASVAVLTRGVNLDWESTPLRAGSPLVPGVLKWRSGVAQIEFYQGARLAIEGPAEVELISSGEATVRQGKLSANVPPQARGFRINTPDGAVVDLGTEFGLEVGDGKAEVHVFDGEVELYPSAASEMLALTGGQGARFAGEASEVEADPAAFASLSQIDQRSAVSMRSEFASWIELGARLNQDPGLRLRFDFQDPSPLRRLSNQAEQGRDIEDGSIVGAGWTQGRWPGKQALEFRNVSDRVRLYVPGETRALTYSAWVRVHGLDRAFNSLFMSESWGKRRVHWQIRSTGEVRLGVAGPEGKKGGADYDSPVLFPPERFGQWTHLAVSFDPETGQVKHYADGKCVATLKIKDASPLRIGMAELGNWNDAQGSTHVAIRNFSGAMDEFCFWDRVLTEEEIAALAIP